MIKNLPLMDAAVRCFSSVCVLDQDRLTWLVCYGRSPTIAGRWPFCFSADVLFFLTFFLLFLPPNLWCRLADRHQTLPHGRQWLRFIKLGQKFGCPPKIWWTKNVKFWRNFAQLHNLIANISQAQHIINQKMALQTTDTPALANVTWCTLVHKWLNRTGVLTHPLAIVQRTGINKSVSFDRWRHWPTQRAAITLGFATLSSLTKGDAGHQGPRFSAANFVKFCCAVC